jgi:small subunit ribosomal protein S17
MGEAQSGEEGRGARASMSERGGSRTRIGVVVSDKMKKSVVVEVSRQITHPVYHKIVRVKKRFMAHDESNACAVGDRVRIVESRPLSRRKRWRVKERLV